MDYADFRRLKREKLSKTMFMWANTRVRRRSATRTSQTRLPPEEAAKATEDVAAQDNNRGKRTKRKASPSPKRKGERGEKKRRRRSPSSSSSSESSSSSLASDDEAAPPGVRRGLGTRTKPERNRRVDSARSPRRSGESGGGGRNCGGGSEGEGGGRVRGSRRTASTRTGGRRRLREGAPCLARRRYGAVCASRQAHSRRGEVGLSADQISRFEDLGYVMSGSRHSRMNAIRIRKENQVYSAEEKAALAMINYEEKAAREQKVMEDLKKLVAEATRGLNESERFDSVARDDTNKLRSD